MMEVILLERVGRLGAIGAVVTVKPGFARNYLLPQHKALRATNANMARFEAQRASIEARNADARAAAAATGEKLDGQVFVLIRQAGEGGQLYGSVAARDVADAAIAAGFEVARNQIVLDKPIKTIGMHAVVVRLHPEVEITVTANVARTEDEATRQAKGEDVIASRFEEERAEDAAQAAEIAESAVQLDGFGGE
jgi:large subunit ribosomal protein L9